MHYLMPRSQSPSQAPSTPPLACLRSLALLHPHLHARSPGAAGADDGVIPRPAEARQLWGGEEEARSPAVPRLKSQVRPNPRGTAGRGADDWPWKLGLSGPSQVASLAFPLQVPGRGGILTLGSRSYCTTDSPPLCKELLVQNP